MIPRLARTVVSLLLVMVGIDQGGRAVWIQAKAELAQVLLARSWQRTLAGHGEARPWPWSDAWPVARLRLPTGDHVVLSGANGRNLAFAPGHLDGSAEPGAVGACVIAGHRDTHFAGLDRLLPGTVVTLEGDDGAIHDYRVVSSTVVHERGTWAIADDGSRSLVLVTCWPLDAVIPGGPMRLVVRAELVASHPPDPARGSGLGPRAP